MRWLLVSAAFSRLCPALESLSTAGASLRWRATVSRYGNIGRAVLRSESPLFHFVVHRAISNIASSTRATAFRVPVQARASGSLAVRCRRAFAQAAHNPSLKLTRYGSRRLAAPGASGIIPSAAKRHLPPRAA